MTARTPETRAAVPPAARGSAPPVADPAGTPRPTLGVPAQDSRPPRIPSSPGAGGTPGPETAWPGPVSVRAGDQAPAGVPTPRAGGTPAGSSALSGEEWRKEVKRVTSSQHAEARRRATRYVPRSRKGVQAATGPGMVRRMPPPQTPGGDAA